MNGDDSSRILEADETLGDIVDILVLAVNPDRIFLFGSRSRESEVTGSDYDLLIVKNGVSNEREVSRAAYRSLLDHGSAVPVDILVADEERLEIARGKIGNVLAGALVDGVKIYERA
ncbi:MAG TPA: nucleotidyltransferase domain-containing protein [Spirochaetia bacterium]|nr:nucleotidyltransferase domain-containing protein [Spirochaetales bacterium]HRY79751.1 nucleotidyltransferase domain-containing protein [Spirochaetia bacterium]HRZ89347.1 nucleotidyltransferase domain-containing protein [Spirochaetia bacterium]